MADAAAPVKETKKQEKARKKLEKAALKAAMKAAMVEGGLATAEAAPAVPSNADTEKKSKKTSDKSKAAGGLEEDVEGLDINSVARGQAGELTNEQLRVATVRASTGVLASMEQARDLKFVSFSVMVGGNQLVTDCDLELNYGCRYGLIGSNGSGKSNVLAAIAQRDIPLPEHVDVYHLHEEAPANELTGVEAVVKHVVDEAKKLEELSERIMEENGMDDERLEAIYERLDELDPTGSEPRARLILSGLGFADHLIPMDRKTKHMSGGWRMRVSLAKALFAAPSLLLLDEVGTRFLNRVD
jgi:ATP-binding cassette subfamily F protein 2